MDWGDTVTEDELLQIASIDFSKFNNILTDDNPMYDSFKAEYENKEYYKDKLIFDDNKYTVWKAW